MAKKETEKKSVLAPANEGEKLVKIRIPRTRDEKDDVFVSVNERTWLIKRGEEVEVPECVAEVIRHHEDAVAFADEHDDGVE